MVVLFFVFLESIELAESRVAIRVSKGGHNIPPETIRRRYKKGVKNFRHYAGMADSWHIYDNSGPAYQLIGQMLGDKEEIFNFEVFRKIMSNEG